MWNREGYVLENINMGIRALLQDFIYGKKESSIVYYPIFDSSEELTSHYYRACWYLPSQNNECQAVYCYRKIKVVLNDKPEYMGTSNVPTDHIIIRTGTLGLKRAALNARVVLLWKKCDKDFINVLKQRGVFVVNVDTNDETAAEYGRYCDLIWRYFKSDIEKKQIIQHSYNLFAKRVAAIKKNNWITGCVFGTGPSLETAKDFDFSNCVSVVCNSIVQNKDLLSHINPQFVTAGDVVSHLGVSLYAEVFRKDLVEYLKNNEVYYFTTAPFGYLLLEQCSEIAHKVILVEQQMDEQNFDLTQLFCLPKLDSTFNIHMLPIIHTLCDNIFILGCDGKSKTRSNEDFWAHAQDAQYAGLVDTGHKCHPTFDINRKKNTYNRYQNSVMHSIEEGEKQNGKRYYTLQQSNIDALADKKLPDVLRRKYNVAGQLMLSEIFEKKLQDKREEEMLKEYIEVTRDEDLVLISGWVLAKNPCMIEVYVNDKLSGYAVKNLKRPDVYKKYPEYEQLFAGIYYYINSVDLVNVTWKIVENGKVIKELEQMI